MSTQNDLETLRAEYRAIRRRTHAENNQVFDAAVKTWLLQKGLLPTPANFVDAALAVTFKCRRCSGTGKFVTYIENGQPRGPGGDCFRCMGRGYQNDADARRNYGADLHQLSRAS